MTALTSCLPHAAAAPRRRAATVLLGLFFVVTLVAPAAPLNKLLFLLIGAWLLKDMLFAPCGTVVPMAPPFIVLAIFAYGFILSWVNWTHGALALQFFTAALVLFLIHFVRRHAIDLDRLVEISSNVLLTVTALFWVGTLWPELPFAATVKALVEEFGQGAVAERDFLETSPTLSLHMGTVPFLYVPFCLRLVRLVQRWRWRDALLLLLLAVAIVLSASRGLIAITALFLLVVVIGRVPPLVRVVALVVAAVLLYLVNAFVLSNSMLLSTEEVSNAGKIGHFRSYFDDLTLGSVLAGRGLANYYYSSGSGGFVAHTEITPLDMARYLGLILTTVLYGTLLMPSAQLRRYGGRNRLWVFAFVLYLVLSATNPVMFNSYGMLVVMWYWWKITSAPTPLAARMAAT